MKVSSLETYNDQDARKMFQFVGCIYFNNIIHFDTEKKPKENYTDMK